MQSQDTRQAYQQKVQAKLEKVNAQIAEYKAKAAQVEADSKVQYHSTIEELTTQRDALQAKFQEFQAASDAAWTEIQQGLDKALEEGGRAFENAFNKFQ